MIGAALTGLVANRNKLVKAILGLIAAFLLSFGINLYQQNKKLSEGLERALNNIEAYLGSLLGSLLANNVLRLTVDELQTQNDILINKLDSVRDKLKIKPKNLNTAATLTQSIYVNQSKEINDSIMSIIRDSVHNDSIMFNDLTKVLYSISKDTISITLDIKNLLYLYIYKDKHYKNKKNFLKRLFTFDFKKVTTYKYEIVNTNNLIDTDNVRVVEITDK